MFTDNPVLDAERNIAERDAKRKLVGYCEQCGSEIYSDEIYYDIDGLLLHYNCDHDWLRNFLKDG